LRSNKQEVTPQERTEVTDYFPGYLLVAMIVLLILASFIPNKPDITNGLICVALLVVGLLREVAKGKGAQVIKTCW